MKFVLLLLLFLSCTHSPVRAPASLRENCTSFIDLFENINHDSSVELELTLFPEVMNLLTTQNGKLDSLLNPGQLDTDFQKIITEKFKNRSLTEISWDELSFDEKINAIELAHKHLATSDFFNNRSIQGIKMRDYIEVDFVESTKVGNTIYPQGKHRLKLKKLFHQVEFQSPGDVRKLKGVELHFRTKMSAGDASLAAWKILDLLKIARPHQHIHMVAKIPREEIKKDPVYYPARIVEFVRRVNLFSEMYAMLNEHASLKNVKTDKIEFFGSLKQRNLITLYNYFTQFAHPRWKPEGIADELKIAYVAPRGHDKYDEEFLWGLEYRAIDKEAVETNLKVILDNIQQLMIKNDFSVSSSDLETWHKNVGDLSKNMGQAISSQWYHHGIDVPEVDYGLKIIFPDINDLSQKYFGDLQTITKDRNELHYLFHYWANDPLFYNDSEKLNRLVQAQIKALIRLENEYSDISQLTSIGPRMGLERVNEIVREFLVESGLYEVVGNSLKIKHLP